MKRLILLLLLPSIVLAQAWDSTKTTDTPRTGMYKFNAGIKDYIAGKRIDTTGMSAMTNPIFVLQYDTIWVAKEGTIDSSTAGRMIYKSSSSSLSNLGGMYVPQGLVSGGVTDNRSAIQTALTAASTAGGGTVYLPLGTYRVNDTLNLYSGVNLEGEGTISVPSTFTGSGVLISRSDTILTVRGIKIDLSAITDTTTDSATDSLTNVSGIFISLGSKITIDGVTVSGQNPSRTVTDYGTGCGVWVEYSSNVIVKNSRIEDSPMHNVSIGYGSSDCSVLNNVLLNAKRNNGIEVIGDPASPSDTTLYTTGTIVSGNHCVDNGDAGVEIFLAPKTTVYGNNIVNSNLHGTTPTSPSITVEQNSHNSTISGNVCTNGSRGIVVYGSSYVTVLGNTVKNHTSIGIELEYGYSTSSSNCLVSSNVIRKVGGDGIYVYRSTHNVLVGNNIDSSNSNGIELSDTSDYNSIVGNNIQHSKYTAIYLKDVDWNTVSGNMAIDNSVAGIDSAAGIRVSDSSRYNSITGNIVTDTRAVPQQQYGIKMAASCQYNMVANNILAKNKNGGTEPLNDSTSVYAGNITDDGYQGQFVIHRGSQTLFYSDASDNINVNKQLNVYGQANLLSKAVILDSLNQLALLTTKTGQVAQILFKDSLTTKWNIVKDSVNNMSISNATTPVITMNQTTKASQFFGPLTLGLHTIAAGDSVFGNMFVRNTDSLLVMWSGTAWITVADLTP